jgi:hypothetical protein
MSGDDQMGNYLQWRNRAAQNAGALIDCEVIALGMKDCEIRADHLDTRKEFIDLFRSSDFVKTLAKMRGIQSGCAYAEGFIQHMVWARPNTIRFPV